MTKRKRGGKKATAANAAAAADTAVDGDAQRTASTREGRSTKNAEKGREEAREDEESEGQDDSAGEFSDDDDSEEDNKGALVLDGALAEEDISSDSDEEMEEAQPQKGKGKGKAKAAPSQRRKGSGKATVQVNFDFCDPAERFFHGLKALLAPQLPPKWGINTSDLTDIITAQASVGTVVTSGDEDGGTPDDSVFAFSTVVPLQFHADKPAVAALISALLSAAAKAGKGSEMEQLLGEAALEGHRVGLFLHGRMLNVPLQVVSRMHESLCEDIVWALENEISQEHKEKFRFDRLLLLAPCEGIAAASGDGGSSSSNSKKKAAKKPPAAAAMAPLASELLYTRFEDEILVGDSENWFAVPVAAPEGGGRSGQGQQYLVVAALPADAVRRCVPQVEQLVGGV